MSLGGIQRIISSYSTTAMTRDVGDSVPLDKDRVVMGLSFVLKIAIYQVQMKPFWI